MAVNTYLEVNLHFLSTQLSQKLACKLKLTFLLKLT